MKKISDNPSAKELRKQIQGAQALKAVFDLIPLASQIFPGVQKAFESLDGVVEQAALLEVPDRFNETFAQHGWIAYESMALIAMTRALDIAEESGLATAEQFLAETYDEETLSFGIMRCTGHVDFRKRVRLIELAKEDFLAGRCHACVPLLLALIDGLANDVSKHIGFFAEGADLTAWDSIAAHETGLRSLAKTMGIGRNKTNEEEITIPYRNGILHGRELAFDNKIVAAKCWAALFAMRDWASARASPKDQSDAKMQVGWGEVLQSVAETNNLKRALDRWRPRAVSDLRHLPSHGPAATLPVGTPEWVVAEFLDNWCSRRYGLMAESLMDYLDRPKGKKAGNARRDFERYTPSGYRLISVTDKTPAMSQVDIELLIGAGELSETVQLSIGLVFSDLSNEIAIWKHSPGSWKIVQNGFGSLIYRS